VDRALASGARGRAFESRRAYFSSQVALTRRNLWVRRRGVRVSILTPRFVLNEALL
jgi:hypothetical protein